MPVRVSILCWLMGLAFLFPPQSFAQDSEFQGYVQLKSGDQTFNSETVKVTPPAALLEGVEGNFTLEITIKEIAETFTVYVKGIPQEVTLTDGKGTFSYTPQPGETEIPFTIGPYETQIAISPIPLWLSIVPPLLAIVLALVFKEVFVSLFCGIFLGAGIIGFYANGVMGIWEGFLEVISTYLLESLADKDHAAIIMFSLLIGGMVSLITQNGGMSGVVKRISSKANSTRSVQTSTWLLGIAIFFDDYANTLVVGNAMRPLSDKYRISREKLSYIVDSTAAPVSALAFITTWIGAELGYIQDGIGKLEGFPTELSAYGVFLESLAYAFYPILTLVFIFMLIRTGRDFGPMYRAELRARETGQVSIKDDHSPVPGETPEIEVDPGIPQRAYNALIPIGVLVLGVIIGLATTGYDAEAWNTTEGGFFRKLSDLLGRADSYKALLWASLSAVVAGIILTVAQRILHLKTAVEAVFDGFRTMMSTMVVLVLAWALAAVTENMHTADYLTQVLGDQLNPFWVPAITFVLAAGVAFATGTSWGTMAILYPLMIPFTWTLCLTHAGMTTPDALPLLFNVVSAVLAGAVLGDHCSPISDTTILSSLACDCDHIDHVRTQLPYALTVGAVSIFAGTLPAAYGLSSWVCFPLGIAVLFGLIQVMGRKTEFS